MLLRYFITSLALITLVGCKTSSSGSDDQAVDSGNTLADAAQATVDATSEQNDSGILLIDSGGDVVDASVTRVLLTEDVAITTSDNINVHGVLTRYDDVTEQAPAILLLHQFRQDHTQWDNFKTALADEGYIVLAIDLRGHGKSDAYQGTNLNGILNDPNGAPNDVRAALVFLAAQSYVDNSRLGVIGTSIGGNLAVASSILELSKTSIAISPRLPPTENLADTSANNMKSVYYIAAENDSGGQAQDCQTMYERTEDPRAIHIYSDTADHGRALFESQSDMKNKIIMWMAENL